MRMLLKIACVIVGGVVLGLVACWATLGHGAMGRIGDGPWKTSVLTGTRGGDPYLKASTVLHGLFTLNRSEALYYTTTTDSAGGDLDGNCIYHLTGREPDARWWSITVYRPDDTLIPNRAKRYSITKDNVVRASDGSFTITLARDSVRRNWIPLTGKAFVIVMRLYEPGIGAGIDPSSVSVPRIERAVCP